MGTKSRSDGESVVDGFYSLAITKASKGIPPSLTHLAVTALYAILHHVPSLSPLNHTIQILKPIYFN